MKIPKKTRKRYKPEQPKIKGYLRIGSMYVSLVFLVSVLIAFFSFGMVYVTALHPVVMDLWYSRKSMPEFSIQSPYLAEYDGKAKLLMPDGSLLYEGDVGGAVVSGNGRLYQNGFLLYDGGFKENLYDGRGTLYGEDGSVIYTGDFAENLFHGLGTLYFSRGASSFTYTGEFDSGVRNGEGTLAAGGVLIYEGGFKDNMRDGFGREYENGRLRYEGMFLRDVYEGEGKLFDGGGRLVYEGGFSGGKYGGDGTEYNPDTGYPVFQGKYLDGSRMEAGTEYNAQGIPIVDEPSSPNPLELLDATYTDALTALSKNSAACREQAIDGRRLVIDEPGGVIYAFSLNEAGEPETLSEIYLFGLASAEGLIVGSQMGDTAESLVSAPEIGEGERFALSLSNIFWGKETQEGDLVIVAPENGGAVAAFCDASDKPPGSLDEPNAGPPDGGPAGNPGKVLPGDPPADAPGKILPGDPGAQELAEESPENAKPVNAGRIVFLKVGQPQAAG